MSYIGLEDEFFLFQTMDFKNLGPKLIRIVSHIFGKQEEPKFLLVDIKGDNLFLIRTLPKNYLTLNEHIVNIDLFDILLNYFAILLITLGLHEQKFGFINEI